MATRIVSAPEAAWLNVVEELAGSPLIDSEIVPLKLPLVVAEIANDDAAPRRTEAVGGVICSVNAGLALIVSVTVVVLLSVPLVPVMVRRNVPAAAVAAAVNASAAVPPAATLAGVNLDVTPAGRPVTPSATNPVKPPVPVAPIVVITLAPPLVSATAAEAAFSVKPGVAFGGVVPVAHDCTAL